MGIEEDSNDKRGTTLDNLDYDSSLEPSGEDSVRAN